MLTAAFADALGVSEDEAHAMLLDFSRRVNEQAAMGPVEITGLGTFEQRGDGLTFAPDDTLALIVNHVYADLRPLPMHGAVLQRTPEPEPTPESEPDIEPEPESSAMVPEAPLAPLDLEQHVAPEPEAPTPVAESDTDEPAAQFEQPPGVEAVEDEDDAMSPLGELPMPPLFASDDTLSTLRDMGRDLDSDPHVHRWADDLIREEGDDEPAPSTDALEDDSPFAFVDDDPAAFDPEPFALEDDDAVPTFAPAFEDSFEPELPPASEPPEITIPEPSVPEPVYAAPEPDAPAPDAYASDSPIPPQPVEEAKSVAIADDGLSDEDLTARIAPVAGQFVAPPAAPTPPDAEPAPRRSPPPPRERSSVPLLVLLGVAILLIVAAMAWWLTRSDVADSTVAVAPADTAQVVAPMDTVETPAVEPETALRGSTPVSVPPGYTVVIGSGATVAEAEALAAPYRELGYRTGILVGDSRGRRLYRVGVGQFETLSAAIAARDGALREGDLRTLTPSDAFTFPFR